MKEIVYTQIVECKLKRVNANNFNEYEKLGLFDIKRIHDIYFFNKNKIISLTFG